MPELTVIIPMYNCAPVITRCLASIDYQDCEIIVVNDGSTDNGAKIVEQYAAKKNNIRLINKVNGGVSSARNIGLKKAIGKYIVFVDADDYLMSDGLARVVKIADENNADVVLYTANYTYDDSLIPIRSVKNDTINVQTFVSGKEVLRRYDIADYYVWDAVYSREMLLKNHIECKEDLCLHEDDVFKGEVYSAAGKTIATDLHLYCYVRDSKCSSTHQQSLERQRELIISGLRAANYRKMYIQDRCPEVIPLECLKYMRWICQPQTAIKAGYTLREYESLLDKFQQLGIYPLKYKWINVAHWYATPKQKIKFAIKTFMTNHPVLSYYYFNLLSRFKIKR